MTLYYNSLSAYIGPIGKKWTHTYDIKLVKNLDGSMILQEGDGQRRTYTKSDNGYKSPAGDYSVLTQNTDNTFLMTQKDGLRYVFDQSGRIASIIDRNGNTMTFTYINGNLTNITDSNSRTTTFSYDTGNRIDSITDPGGSIYVLTYSNSVLATVTNPNGGRWSYSYDADAFMLSKTDPINQVTMYTYDSNHRQVTATNPEGHIKIMTYVPGNKTSLLMESDGGVWTYKYDTTLGVPLQKTDPQGNSTSYTYDHNKNMISRIDPSGATTTYVYDLHGNMTSTTDALWQTTSYTYNNFSQVTSVTDPQGNTTQYIYDAKGNLTSTIDPTGAVTKYQPDSKGNITSITNASGQTTTFTYDQYNNITSFADPTGAVTKFTYDASGDITSWINANGAITTFVYNSQHQLIKVTDPDGDTTTYTYDKNGNRITQTDANGNTTYFTYNYKNLLILVKDTIGAVTTYTYGGAGCASCVGGTDKLTSITDAKGNSTTYQYDQTGKLIRETDPLGNSMNYFYDATGNLISKTDANGNAIKLSYDITGRLIGKAYPDGTQESFVYDGAGNLIDWQTPRERLTLTYNAANRLTTKTFQNLGKGVKYEYDSMGRKSAMIDAEGGRTAYTYDAAGRVTKISDPFNNWVSYSYDASGRRSDVTYSNGTSTAYTYDPAGRLLSIITTGPTGVISSYQYTYDKVGNRLSVTEAGGNSTQYVYDRIYRLIGYDETRPDASKGTFEYDLVGNRIKMILAKKYLPGDSRNLTYTYNSANQLLGIVEKGRHSPIGTAYIYDKNGSLVSQAVTQGKTIMTTIYQNDYQNRLVNAVMPNGKLIAMENLGDGLTRLSKTTDAGTTRYLHAGMGVLAEYDASGNRTTRYTLGPRTDEIIAKKDAIGIYFYHYDGLGSVVAITDASGKVVARYDYEPFGRMKETTSALLKNSYTYTGREWDEDIGLYYYRARYYDAKVGRFSSKDSIGFRGGINLYGYVGNNPINRRDPSGKAPLWFEILDILSEAYLSLFGHVDKPGEGEDEWMADYNQRQELYRQIDQLEKDIPETKARLDELIKDLERRKKWEKENCLR